MKTFDLIAMCLRNLMRRKFRTLLTLVGVVAGTCAVVLMIALGLGMKASQDAMLSQMGDLSIIEIFNYGGGGAQGKPVPLDDAKMKEIAALPGVVAATPFYSPRNLDAKLFGGRNDRYMSPLYSIVGVYPETLPTLGYELLEGSWEDAFQEPYSMLMGQYAAYQFQDSRKKRGNNRIEPFPNALGEIPSPYVNVLSDKLLIRITQQKENARKIEYIPKATGILKEDFQRGYETSRGIYMNVADVRKMEEAYIKANNIKQDKDQKKLNYENAKVKVSDIQYVTPVEEAIKGMGFQTNSMDSIRKPMEEQAGRQQLFLGVIAGVSLFVAALSIANTMLMSVYERTREIGVMKVVGCFVRDIRTVFLMEAGCIGFIGGTIGVLLSYTLAFLMNFFGINLGLGSSMDMGMGMATGGSMFVIPPWLVLVALAFSTLIGVLSGYFPANRAVKISALTAIKQD